MDFPTSNQSRLKQMANSSAFVLGYIANNTDPDQTAPLSRYIVFASMIKSSLKCV